jgi:hypothetical protein
MDVRAFLVSVIYHRIEKKTKAHFQYQILNLIKLCSDSFQSKYIPQFFMTQHSWLLCYYRRPALTAKTKANQTVLFLFIEQRRTTVVSIHISIKCLSFATKQS